MRRRYFWISRFDGDVDLDLSGLAGWSLESRVVVPKASGFIIVVLVIVTLAAAADFQ